VTKSHHTNDKRSSILAGVLFVPLLLAVIYMMLAQVGLADNVSRASIAHPGMVVMLVGVTVIAIVAITYAWHPRGARSLIRDCAAGQIDRPDVQARWINHRSHM
jgi:hypothetical protein